VWKAAGNALQVGKDAVAPLAVQPAERVGEKGVVVDPEIPTIIHPS
jgi:hypothetical protein